MTIKTPTSFPYLAIAKRHGLDYGHVLAIADAMTHKRYQGDKLPRWPGSSAYAEILGAQGRFTLIQQGIIKPF